MKGGFLTKKTSLFLIIFMIITINCIPCLDTTAEEANESFIFRNGITWGMTRQEIISIEGNKFEEEEYKGGIIDTTLMYENKYISDYTGKLLFGLRQNSLIFTGYDLDYFSKEDFEVLLTAYSTKYGESENGISDYIIYCGQEDSWTEDELLQKGISAYKWVLKDNTMILFVRDSSYSKDERADIGIIYLSPDAVNLMINKTENKEINLTGI